MQYNGITGVTGIPSSTPAFATTSNCAGRSQERQEARTTAVTLRANHTLSCVDGDNFTDDSQNGSHRARVDEQPGRDEHKETGDFEDEVDDGENSRVFPTPSAKEALFFVHIQSFD